MANQSELHETLGEVFGYRENGESLINHLAFIGKQLERIANALEKRD